MPLYDFKCDKCNIVFEHFTHSYDTTGVTCDCGGLAKKQISAPRVLKIDGFPANIKEDSWAKTREKNHKKQAQHEDW